MGEAERVMSGDGRSIGPTGVVGVRAAVMVAVRAVVVTVVMTGEKVAMEARKEEKEDQEMAAGTEGCLEVEGVMEGWMEVLVGLVVMMEDMVDLVVMEDLTQLL